MIIEESVKKYEHSFIYVGKDIDPQDEKLLDEIGFIYRKEFNSFML